MSVVRFEYNGSQCVETYVGDPNERIEELNDENNRHFNKINHGGLNKKRQSKRIAMVAYNKKLITVLGKRC